MGPETFEQVQKGKLQYVSIDKDEQCFVINKKHYPAISGLLLGFSKHKFVFKGADQWKFDIFLKADAIYQVQLGLHTYPTLSVMNTLRAFGESLKEGKLLRLEVVPGNNGPSIYMTYNGEKGKWKMEWEELKFNGKEGDAKTSHRDNIIDKWFDALFELMPYVPEVASEESDAVPADVADDDDIPF